MFPGVNPAETGQKRRSTELRSRYVLSVFASHLPAFANFIERCFTFISRKTTLLPVGSLTKHRIRLAELDGRVESAQQHLISSLSYQLHITQAAR